MPHQIMPALLDKATPIDQLHPHPDNARTRSAKAKRVIRESLEDNGQYKTVVARRLPDGTLQLMLGHGTVDEARTLGWTHVAADIHDDVDDTRARKIVAVDNRSSDLAGYDDNLLAQLLAPLEDDLRGSGYDRPDYTALLAGLRHPPALTDPDDAPPLPPDPQSKVGDVWVLGEHRLVVGDATDSGVYDRLLAGQQVDAVWTDPPYGVTYVGGSKKREAISNDALDALELEGFLRASLGLAIGHTSPGAAWYVTAPDGVRGLAFSVVLAELQVWRHTLIWVKNNSTLGRGDYHNRHEPIYYGWTPGGPHHKVADRRQDSVWEHDRPPRSAEHPTMKPVDLIARALENSTDLGQLVLDVFAGSGPTLIACHQSGRVARLVELDCGYADVICRRFEEHTGVVPVLEKTGQARSFV